MQVPVDQLQLVLLCKEKFVKTFGLGKIFQSIFDEVKEIEDVGLELFPDHHSFGTISYICGDNLGSHSLGGFSENFSNEEYFCRYCLIHKDNLSTKNVYAKHEIRTKENYNEAVNNNQQNGSFKTKGIKFNSPFNSLKYFHVCAPGLPPCLGHDLFEGLVSYDLALYMKHFINKKVVHSSVFKSKN